MEEKVGHENPVDYSCTQQSKHREHNTGILAPAAQIVITYISKL